MGLIADLDGPQFVAERRGPHIPDISSWPEASAVRSDISVALSAKKRPSSGGAKYSSDAAPDGAKLKSTSAIYKDYAPHGAGVVSARLKPLMARRAPGPVTQLWCQPTQLGGLMFTWRTPPGAIRVDGYRLERTRDGRAYEEIAETRNESFILPPVPFNDGWFYRVSAFNERGQGPADEVYFYLRRRRHSILQYVLVRPGLRVNICKFVR